MRRLLVGCAVLLFVSTAVAQQQPRATETIEVSIVNLDVVVTDKSGKRITGLKPQDFEIREAGKVQPISNFAEYRPSVRTESGTIGIDTPAPSPAASAEAAAPSRPPRTIVVFVEWDKLTPFGAKQMYDGIRDLLRQTVVKGDKVMLVSWTGAALIRQPFTDDLTQIRSVLAEMEQDHLKLRLSDIAGDVQREQAAADQGAVDAMTAQPGGASPSAEAVSDALAHAKNMGTFIRHAVQRQRAQIRAKAAALEALMNSMAAYEGRKVLIMATRRFGAFAGAEFFPGADVPLDQRQELSTAEFHQSLVRTANAHGVTIYPIYHGGLRWNPDDASVHRDIDDPLQWTPENDLVRSGQDHKTMFNETSALTAIAEATGGVMASGPGGIVQMLPHIADDLESYYSLGYRARSTGKDVTRRVEVRTKNRDYAVRSRTQIVEKSDATRMKDRLVANLLQQIEESKLPFEVEVGAFKETGRKRWEVLLKLRIPISALTTLPQGAKEVGAFSVYAVAGGTLGLTSDVQHRTQAFEIPHADLERARESHFTYDVALQIDEKSQRLSVAVVDETAREVGLKSLPLPAR